MKTAMQEHIQWLEDTLEITKEFAPSLDQCIRLCMSDAKHRLDDEQQRIKQAYNDGKRDAYRQDDVPTADEYVYQRYGHEKL
jgi:hypothetical protein